MKSHALAAMLDGPPRCSGMAGAVLLAEAYAVGRREPVRAQQVIGSDVVEVELVDAVRARSRPVGIAMVAAAAEEPCPGRSPARSRGNGHGP